MKTIEYQNLIKLVIKSAIILVVSLGIVSPALAVSQELQFDTTAGYKVKATFSYDEAKPIAIRERGHGKTTTINSMKVSFYKPSGELIADYDNIVDGMVTGNYFEFNFNPATQQLFGSIDIGGESAGEMYLKGEAERELSLIEVDRLGEEKAIDLVFQPMD